jgi:hypothetical protein
MDEDHSGPQPDRRPADDQLRPVKHGAAKQCVPKVPDHAFVNRYRALAELNSMYFPKKLVRMIA